MKKLVSLGLSLVLMLSLSMTALAAPSPSANVTVGAVTASTSVKLASGSVATVAVVAVTSAVKDAGAAYVATLNTAAVVLDVVEVNLTGASAADFEAGVTLTFNVTGVKAGDVVYVLHQKADGTWENFLADSVGNGTVTATFHSLSPVGFVLANTVVVPEAAATSPKTGQTSTVLLVELMALISFAGAAVFAKRAQVSK